MERKEPGTLGEGNDSVERHSLSELRRRVASKFAFDELKKHKRIYTLIVSAYTADIAMTAIKPTTYAMAQLTFLGRQGNSQEMMLLLNAFFSHPLIAGALVYSSSVASEFGMWSMSLKVTELGRRAIKSTYPKMRDAVNRSEIVRPMVEKGYDGALEIARRDTHVYPRAHDALSRFEELRERRKNRT